MAIRPVWINKDEWESGAARELLFEGRVPEGGVYEAMDAERIETPEGMMPKKPSYWRVVLALDPQRNFRRYQEVTVGGQWITVVRFVPEGANRSLNFTQAAAGAQKDEAAQREDSQLSF